MREPVRSGVGAKWDIRIRMKKFQRPARARRAADREGRKPHVVRATTHEQQMCTMGGEPVEVGGNDEQVDDSDDARHEMRRKVNRG